MRYMMLVLVMAGVTLGQTTQPATAPSAALQNENSKLRAENYRLEQQSDEFEKQIANLQKRIDRLNKQIESLRGTDEPEQPEDGIAEAIQEQRLAIGMTVEQAEQALGAKGFVHSEAEGIQMYRFIVSEVLPDRTFSTTMWGQFENGKLTYYEKGAFTERSNTVRARTP